jgi:hypothetical protein
VDAVECLTVFGKHDLLKTEALVELILISHEEEWHPDPAPNDCVCMIHTPLISHCSQPTGPMNVMIPPHYMISSCLNRGSFGTASMCF